MRDTKAIVCPHCRWMYFEEKTITKMLNEVSRKGQTNCGKCGTGFHVKVEITYVTGGAPMVVDGERGGSHNTEAAAG